MYELKKIESYLWVNLLGPGPSSYKTLFTGPRSHKGWETLLYCMNYGQPCTYTESEYGCRDRGMRFDYGQWQSIASSTLGVHKSRTNIFCTMGAHICGPTVWCLFNVTILAPIAVWLFRSLFWECVFTCCVHSVHTCCGIYCTSYTMDTGSKTAGALKLTTHILLVKVKQSLYRFWRFQEVEAHIF
jgi:hypothetical protein